MVKNLPAMQETQLQSLGEEDSPEKRLVTRSSVFVWRIPWIEEPGKLQSMGLPRVRHCWAILANTLRSGNMTKKEIRLFFRLVFDVPSRLGWKQTLFCVPLLVWNPPNPLVLLALPPTPNSEESLMQPNDQQSEPKVESKERDPVDSRVGNVVSRYSRKQRKSKGPRQEASMNLKAILDTCVWLIIRKK